MYAAWSNLIDCNNSDCDFILVAVIASEDRVCDRVNPKVGN